MYVAREQSSPKQPPLSFFFYCPGARPIRGPSLRKRRRTSHELIIPCFHAIFTDTAQIHTYTHSGIQPARPHTRPFDGSGPPRSMPSGTSPPSNPIPCSAAAHTSFLARSRFRIRGSSRANPSCRAAGPGRHYRVVHSNVTLEGLDGSFPPATTTIGALGGRILGRVTRVS